MSAALAIAAVELRIAIRNHWIVMAIVVMTLFSLILAFAGSAPGGTVKVEPLTVAVSSLATLCTYLVPLIALLLSYESISGEIDRGTLALTLTYPVARWQIVAGKYLAQLIVVVIAVVIGTGSVVVAVALSAGEVPGGLADLARLQWTAVLLGAVFLSAGNLLSAFSRQPATAASFAAGIWVVAVVMIDVALLGAVVADDGGLFTTTLFPWLLAANPADAFRLFNLLAIEAETGSGFADAPLTLGLPAYTPVVAMLAWIAVLLGGTMARFGRIEP